MMPLQNFMFQSSLGPINILFFFFSNPLGVSIAEHAGLAEVVEQYSVTESHIDIFFD